MGLKSMQCRSVHSFEHFQALYVYERMGQIRTSRMETEDIKEVCTATHLSKPFMTVNSLCVSFRVVSILIVNRYHCLVV